MYQKHVLCAVLLACISIATCARVDVNNFSPMAGGKKVIRRVVASDKRRKDVGKRVDIVAQSGILSKMTSRLPFRKVVPVIAKILGPPPSSLTKINILMLMFYTTLGAAMPFIPLYYRHIGLSNNQVGLLGAITPAVTFLVSPFWGALADSTGWHKHIMLLTFTGSVIARAGLALATKNTNILWLYAIVASSAVLNAPVKPLMDSAVMSMLADKSDYGRSRLYGQIGFGLGSYVVGPLISKDIKLIFLMQLIFAFPTSVLMAGFEPKKSDKQKQKLDVLAAINHMVSDYKVLVFFLMVFLIGVSSGIVENFAYMRIAEVGGNSGNVLGVCRLVSSLAGGPMFWISGDISKRIGVNGVLTWSLTSYVLRFIIYASIKNPWQAIPAEILRGTTFAVFWAGSTYFVYTVSPEGLTATMLSILNGVYGGLGQSVGALVGGAMSKQHGISKSFYLCGAVDLVVLSLFTLYQVRVHFLNRPRKIDGAQILQDGKKQVLSIVNSKEIKSIRKDVEDIKKESEKLLKKEIEAAKNAAGKEIARDAKKAQEILKKTIESEKVAVRDSAKKAVEKEKKYARDAVNEVVEKEESLLVEKISRFFGRR